MEAGRGRERGPAPREPRLDTAAAPRSGVTSLPLRREHDATGLGKVCEDQLASKYHAPGVVHTYFPWAEPSGHLCLCRIRAQWRIDSFRSNPYEVPTKRCDHRRRHRRVVCRECADRTGTARVSLRTAVRTWGAW